MNGVEQIITWMDWATIIFAFFAMFISAVNWWNEKKQLKPIKIIIEKNGERETLPLDIVRKNFTRSEVFGVLGAFDRDSKFSIKYTSTKEFFEQISDIHELKKDYLVIPLDENDKFDWMVK